MISLSYPQTFLIIGLIGFLGSLIIFFSLFRHNIKVTIKEPIGFLTAFLVNTKKGFSNVFFINETESKLEKYKTRINNIVKELTVVAMSDMQISQEEKELIDVIVTDIQAYYSMVSDFESNKELDIKEKAELLEVQKNNILKHAYSNLSINAFDEDLTKILKKLQDVMVTI